ncbi:response regulator transcription factor [Brevibacillus humidisoli]|uniref:response regulator transcription factor n=1 Tax=Brevibacillus humidisoli TaxID=2895522 RepID=UPI001E5EE28C|nr:response regulator transcription factor [Brevibacillus humidisoli]UFJ42582.1 response regulator transcription factor [Brevibacillus humidisoli]
MTRETILLVEDDIEICNLLSMYLEREGFQVRLAHDDTALELVKEREPDLILLDVLLPGLNGFQLCRKLREWTDVPILFLSCKDQDEEKMLGLAIGGDDYISKLASMEEIVARVKAHLRRDRLRRKGEVKRAVRIYEGLEIDVDSCMVRLHGTPVHLSVKELQLLLLLTNHPDKVFSTEEIFQTLWGTQSYGDARTVKVHINNLRKKIEEDPTRPKSIVTIRGLGYKFVSGARLAYDKQTNRLR